MRLTFSGRALSAVLASFEQRLKANLEQELRQMAKTPNDWQRSSSRSGTTTGDAKTTSLTVAHNAEQTSADVARKAASLLAFSDGLAMKRAIAWLQSKKQDSPIADFILDYLAAAKSVAASALTQR